MSRLRTLAVLATIPALAGGCVAAAIPAGAVLLIGRQQLRSERPPGLTPDRATAARVTRQAEKQVEETGKAAPAGTRIASPDEAAAFSNPRVPQRAPSLPAPVTDGRVPPAMQYLYGSGEAAALSIQAYQGLWTYFAKPIAERRAGRAVDSVILSKGATLASPAFDKCGYRPLAVLLDVDETVILNAGYQVEAARRGGFDAESWSRWEQTGASKVMAVPGAAETLSALRQEGVTVVFNSNRDAKYAAETAAALNAAGLGPAEPGKTLWLQGDVDGASGKDARRWAISEKYCVVAVVGDQLGDFTDLFNAGYVPPVRRNLAMASLVSAKWGSGWFLLPNPVYGTALKGDIADVVPTEKQWTDPGPGAVAPPAPMPAATPTPQN